MEVLCPGGSLLLPLALLAFALLVGVALDAGAAPRAPGVRYALRSQPRGDCCQ
jgi:hypothetical protein